jgi:hypothetical protein
MKLIDANALVADIHNANRTLSAIDSSDFTRGQVAANNSIAKILETMPDAGCARDQRTTQYCREALDMQKRVDELERWQQDSLAQAATIQRLHEAAEDRNEVDRLRHTEWQKRLDELECKYKTLKAENAALRGIVANADIPCVYCGLPKDDWAKCASGFPGCARMNDAQNAPGYEEKLNEHMKEHEALNQPKIEPIAQ